MRTFKQLPEGEVATGDIVRKFGAMDEGEFGLVLEINGNEFGNKFLKILKFNGKIKIWYQEKTKVVYKGGMCEYG